MGVLAKNDGPRRGTFTVDTNRAVAKVSPMVPEKPKLISSTNSAPVVNRRMPARRPGAMSAPTLAHVVPSMRRQPGVSSTSNLLRAVERIGHPTPGGASFEAPEPRTPSYATPSYMKPTTAAYKKFKGPQASGTPGRSPGAGGGSNENVPGHRSTGAVMKHQQRMMRKDPSTSTNLFHATTATIITMNVQPICIFRIY